jgi:cell division protein FtsB
LKLRILLGGALLAGAAYFAIFGGDYDVFDVRRVRQERALEEQRAAELAADVERMRAWRDSLANDSATLDRIARERYGLIRDGERLYRFAPPPDSSRPDSGDGAADSTTRRGLRQR